MVEKIKKPKKYVTIGLVGKYVELHDAYLSVVEALSHGGLVHDAEVRIKWISAMEVRRDRVQEIFDDVDGILVPGGFGERGVEGKIEAITYARENNIPFLGICLGMQAAVIEFARNVLGYEGAHSTEFVPDGKYPVIDLMEEQKDIQGLGGTMRLGKYEAKVEKSSKAYEAYGEEFISERHRHRFEFNNYFVEEFEKAGMKFSGKNPQKNLVEIVEIPQLDWFVAVQYHPELKSRPNRPHPLFASFVEHSLKHDSINRR